MISLVSSFLSLSLSLSLIRCSSTTTWAHSLAALPDRVNVSWRFSSLLSPLLKIISCNYLCLPRLLSMKRIIIYEEKNKNAKNFIERVSDWLTEMRYKTTIEKLFKRGRNKKKREQKRFLVIDWRLVWLSWCLVLLFFIFPSKDIGTRDVYGTSSFTFSTSCFKPLLIISRRILTLFIYLFIFNLFLIDLRMRVKHSFCFLFGWFKVLFLNITERLVYGAYRQITYRK